MSILTHVLIADAFIIFFLTLGAAEGHRPVCQGILRTNQAFCRGQACFLLENT